ncbi:MAG: formylglycine-generating enzyme family protein [Spirochaetes bacterium]|nr:formylglycine-generating enzyme family protein [Spirochaetota bacterium]
MKISRRELILMVIGWVVVLVITLSVLELRGRQGRPQRPVFPDLSEYILDTTNALPIEMIRINSGSFIMGSADTTIYGAQPPHSVTISAFYMAKYPVTQEQYLAVMGTNPSWFTPASGYMPAPGEAHGRRPVESVNWYDAIVFSNRLSILKGLTPVYSINGSTNPDDWGPAPSWSDETWNNVIKNLNANGYRLPTEAEWEFASRTGTTTAYYTGDTISIDDAWWSANSGGRTNEVGLKPANAWGLYDMHGNVWEWVWDRHGAYTAAPKTDPVGAAEGDHRVLRGGSWYSSAENLRSAVRVSIDPWLRNVSLGFRVARSEQNQ